MFGLRILVLRFDVDVGSLRVCKHTRYLNFGPLLTPFNGANYKGVSLEYQTTSRNTNRTSREIVSSVAPT